ncbi:MAG: class I SAM-dependent methyltransferase [Pseudomonadales bacterium]|nr:class I SAM-dependent methyltransferase [Pseudomonadales bacterium]
MTEFDSRVEPESRAQDPVVWGTSACPLTAFGVAELLLDAVAIGPGEMLLDLAAGLGHGAGLASQRGAIATGIDRREALLDQARRRYPNALYYLGDPESLVFASGFFAALVHHAGTIHMPSRTTLTEAYRVLAPGGRYAAAIQLGPAVGGPRSARPEADPYSITTAAQIRASWEAVGFIDLRIVVSQIPRQSANLADSGQSETGIAAAAPQAQAPVAQRPADCWPMILVCGRKPAAT